MSFYGASKRSDTPESSSEDLRTAALARYLEETGSGLQKYYTSNPSTVTSESHEATESSGTQHGYHDAGHQTDPTSIPSKVEDDKPIPSDESDYGSSTDRLQACETRTNSDPIEDLRTTVPAGVFGGIGSHLGYDRELREFHHPVNEEEGQAIVNRVAHTTGDVFKSLSMYVANGSMCLAELQEALTNGAQQIKNHGSPYQVSAQPQRRTVLIEDNETVDLERHQDGPEDMQSAGPEQLRPNGDERASRMRFCCCIIWIRR